MSRPVPIASPLAGWATGVVVRPMKRVMSAGAGAAVSKRSTAAAGRLEAARLRRRTDSRGLGRGLAEAASRRRRRGLRLAVRMRHGTATSNLQTLTSIPDNLPLMDFRPSEEQVILRRTVREFAE